MDFKSLTQGSEVKPILSGSNSDGKVSIIFILPSPPPPDTQSFVSAFG